MDGDAGQSEGVEDSKVPTVPDIGHETETVEMEESPLKFKKNLIFKDSATNVTYEIQPGSSKRGRDKLIDSLGFTYNCKPNKNSTTVTWTCSIRNSKLRCPATVIQRRDHFMRGLKKHKHLIGQSLPKPGSQARQTLDLKLKQSRRRKNVRGTVKGNQDYRIIKNGSKSGMDLLKDCLGYTYTFKRTTATGNRTYWNCSVRNKHLRCCATIIQYGEDKFVEGPQEHQHLPAYNIPAEENEEIPSLRKLREAQEEEESEFDEAEIGADKSKTDEEEHSYGSTYIHSGKSSATKRKAVLSKEKKRRDHHSFLGPMCTINLSKCDDPACNCELVHCPFCDTEHFKPTKAGRVQDHLEMTHFAHGVQYDDLMIVKCFKDCDVDRNFGHYHCVFCSQQIIKRDFYARHMLRHLRTMGIPERLLMLPDSKYPDVINAYGYEIPICLKTTCMPSGDKHFHCPCCSQVCLQRSLTVNHLWRCFQKQQGNTEDISDEDETQCLTTVDEDQIMIHFSHAKVIKDLPLEKCTQPNCCNGKYHCVMCPTDTFHPSYKQQLVAHFVTHWKTRVHYKNYGLMRCFQSCQSMPKLQSKIKYHYHCPICTKTIQSRATFEEHLKSCHMLRFGENLIESTTVEDDGFDDTIFLDDDPIAVEFLEDQLIAQAQAYSEKKRLERQKIKKEKVEEKKSQLRPSMFRKPKKELYTRQTYKSEEESDDYMSDSFDDTETFQMCTAVLTKACMTTIRSRKDLQTLLGIVAGQTDSNLSLGDNGQYQLTGTISNLYEAQNLIEQGINKERKFSIKQEADAIDKGSRGPRQRGIKTPARYLTESAAVQKQSKALAKKAITTAVKRGRGRPRKVSNDGDTFPYSEIKEIVNAAKGKSSTDEEEAEDEKEEESEEEEQVEEESEEEYTESKPTPRGRGRPRKSESTSVQPETPASTKRGRGRPPKKTPPQFIKAKTSPKPVEESTPAPKAPRKSASASESKEESSSTPVTPKRYGTRGLRKDYAGMNAGIGITDIKAEPEEDKLFSPKSGRGRPSIASTPSLKRKKTDLNESTSTPSKKRKGADSELGDSQIQAEGEEEIEEMQHELPEEKEVEEGSMHEIGDDVDDVDDTQETVEKEETIIESEEEDIVEIHIYNKEDTKSPPVMTENEATKEVKAGEITTDEKSSPQPLQVQMSPSKTQVKLDASAESTKSPPIKAPTKNPGVQVHVPLTSLIKPSIVADKAPPGPSADVQSTNKPNTQKFQCSYCDKQFSYKSNLDDHENKHTGTTPYQCEICTKAFPSQSMLMKHKTIVHTTIRPYKCSVCHKSFRFMNVLQSHISTHMKTKQHICTKCYKSYSTATTLKFHKQKCKVVNPPHGFTIVGDKDDIVIYTDPSTAPTMLTNQSAGSRGQRSLLQQPPQQQNHADYTIVVEKEVNEETLPATVKEETQTDIVASGEEVVYAESNVEIENDGSNVGEVELYACSECNSAFDSYAKAENHILTAHSVVSG